MIRDRPRGVLRSRRRRGAIGRACVWGRWRQRRTRAGRAVGGEPLSQDGRSAGAGKREGRPEGRPYVLLTDADCVELASQLRNIDGKGQNHDELHHVGASLTEGRPPRVTGLARDSTYQAVLTNTAGLQIPSGPAPVTKPGVRGQSVLATLPVGRFEQYITRCAGGMDSQPRPAWRPSLNLN